MDSVHHIWCPLSSQEFQDLPDGAETTLTIKNDGHYFPGTRVGCTDGLNVTLTIIRRNSGHYRYPDESVYPDVLGGALTDILSNTSDISPDGTD